MGRQLNDLSRSSRPIRRSTTMTSHDTRVVAAVAERMQIRRYRCGDRGAVWRLHNLALRQVDAHPGNGQWDQDLHHIEAEYLAAGGEFLVGVIGERVVAMGALKTTYGSLCRDQCECAYIPMFSGAAWALELLDGAGTVRPATGRYYAAGGDDSEAEGGVTSVYRKGLPRDGQREARAVRGGGLGEDRSHLREVTCSRSLLHPQHRACESSSGAVERHRRRVVREHLQPDRLARSHSWAYIQSSSAVAIPRRRVAAGHEEVAEIVVPGGVWPSCMSQETPIAVLHPVRHAFDERGPKSSDRGSPRRPSSCRFSSASSRDALRTSLGDGYGRARYCAAIAPAACRHSLAELPYAIDLPRCAAPGRSRHTGTGFGLATIGTVSLSTNYSLNLRADQRAS